MNLPSLVPFTILHPIVSGLLVHPGARNRTQAVLHQAPDHTQYHRAHWNAGKHAINDCAVKANSKPRKKPGDDCRLNARAKTRPDAGIAQHDHNTQDKSQNYGNWNEVWRLYEIWLRHEAFNLSCQDYSDSQILADALNQYDRQ